MGITDKFYEAMKVYLILNDKVARLSEAVKGLSDDVRDIDRRVVRLETFVEIAKEQKRLNLGGISLNFSAQGGECVKPDCGHF